MFNGLTNYRVWGLALCYAYRWAPCKRCTILQVLHLWPACWGMSAGEQQQQLGPLAQGRPLIFAAFVPVHVPVRSPTSNSSRQASRSSCCRLWQLFVTLALLPAKITISTICCSFGVELALDNVLPSYLGSNFNFSTTKAGNLAAIFGTLNFIARPIGGVFSDLTGRR